MVSELAKLYALLLVFTISCLGVIVMVGARGAYPPETALDYMFYCLIFTIGIGSIGTYTLKR